MVGQRDSLVEGAQYFSIQLCACPEPRREPCSISDPRGRILLPSAPRGKGDISHWGYGSQGVQPCARAKDLEPLQLLCRDCAKVAALVHCRH